ncbi:Uncharacterised protein (plasmid) [Tsukamurella tyrosinosolvens]|uniref:Uncharacterized protein n=1 Tax=Tsukamurella tyrosinosolvens TaxID=57704 RepID=A0A1H4VKQ5_TSUTY|nr:hypothetical protein [Tsukamurella tyrosinosolvens]KXO90948.1 hypothetical protein AXK58_21175 [Tsukamurella tyrosinosolvens]SEC81712.1 hypothetical protein SAMN04489793_3263 [Tsukamurella tyrosinosolvens]VEH90447.1 Uncharacterised protein [Tsukamurella tyrosinosolvens]
MPAPQGDYGLFNGGPDTRTIEFRLPDGDLLFQVQTWSGPDKCFAAAECTLCGWDFLDEEMERSHVDLIARTHFGKHLDEKGLG